MGKAKAAPCAAPETSCGTPSGWRAGGRCHRCRRAHNEETSHYRGGLTRKRRSVALEALRNGMTLTAAAAAAGTTPHALRQGAARDGELLAALQGLPWRSQQVARQGDYLAALTRTGGRLGEARELVGVSRETVSGWRDDRLYAAAEDAVLKWVRASNRVPARYLSDEDLEQAADLLEAGVPIVRAASEVGATSTALRLAGARHERLRAALPPKKNAATKGAPSRLTPAAERELREMWTDPRYPTLSSIAAHLGVHVITLRKWRQTLGLPRRSSRGRRPKETTTKAKVS